MSATWLFFPASLAMLDFCKLYLTCAYEYVPLQLLSNNSSDIFRPGFPFNPFSTSGPIRPFYLEESISSLAVSSGCFHFYCILHRNFCGQNVFERMFFEDKMTKY